MSTIVISDDLSRIVGSIFNDPNYSRQVEAVQKIRDLRVRFANEKLLIDAYWTNYNAFNIFAMIIAITILEMGYARYKARSFTIVKNLFITCCCAISWYLWGFAFAFGSSVNDGGIGNSFFADNSLVAPNTLNLWITGFTLSVLSTLIATSIIAERYGPFILGLFSIFYAGLCFPLGVHWAWQPEGWLKGLGFVDFSGGAVVHMAGAAAGLAGLVYSSTRRDRFENQSLEFNTSSKTYIGVGGFLLWILFFSFNSGQLRTIISNTELNYTDKVGSVGLNNIVASGVAAIVVFIIQFVVKGLYDLPHMTNALLVGLISITAGGSYYIAWPAICISVASVGIYYGYHLLLKELLKIDDPRSGFAIHFGAGSMGLILTGFFHRTNGLFYEAGGKCLGAQFLGLVIYFAWPFLFSLVFFSIVRIFGPVDPTDNVNSLGEDVAHCGGLASYYDVDSAVYYAEQLAGVQLSVVEETNRDQTNRDQTNRDQTVKDQTNRDQTVKDQTVNKDQSHRDQSNNGEGEAQDQDQE